MNVTALHPVSLLSISFQRFTALSSCSLLLLYVCNGPLSLAALYACNGSSSSVSSLYFLPQAARTHYMCTRARRTTLVFTCISTANSTETTTTTATYPPSAPCRPARSFEVTAPTAQPPSALESPPFIASAGAHGDLDNTITTTLDNNDNHQEDTAAAALDYDSSVIFGLWLWSLLFSVFHFNFKVNWNCNCSCNCKLITHTSTRTAHHRTALSACNGSSSNSPLSLTAHSLTKASLLYCSL
jgi:hypothetical protein